MITACCQYGEEAIIAPVFEGEDPAFLFVVDVGAADGQTLSHSRGLILAGWSALLVEPLPKHVAELTELYARNPRVRIVETAVAEHVGQALMHPALYDSFNSTLVETWRDYATGNGERYGEPIRVGTTPLCLILQAHNVTRVDFLTIDAEMYDLKVLKSNDWARWRPRLVCAEAQPGSDADRYMRGIGYDYLAHTPGSCFWRSSK